MNDRPEPDSTTALGAGSGSATASDSANRPVSEGDGKEGRHPSGALKPPSEPAFRLRSSLAGRLTSIVVSILVVEALLVAGVNRLAGDWWLGLLLALLVGIPLGAWLVSRALRPLDRTLNGLHFGIASFNDHDFSVRLASDRADELGDLARLYNKVGEALQTERLAVRSKELLLESALDNSPVAIVLVNPLDRVVFSNFEARRLLTGGSRLEGRRFSTDIRQNCPRQMRDVLSSSGDGVFSVHDDDESIETYHISHRDFVLNRRKHVLVLLYRMTPELGRQEAAIWKKVIRVISHELNNSLAPVSSLVHSAELISKRPAHADRADEVFATIRERLEHLKEFIDGYARFARLPTPRLEETTWPAMIEDLNGLPPVEIRDSLPSKPLWFDRSQIRQLLINLVKNAHEASEGGEVAISLRVDYTTDGGSCLQVLDRGNGMDEATMKRALLPFYSTKKTGSGLGLALCREVVEGHGGRISLQQRPGGGTAVTCWFPCQTPTNPT